MCLYVRLLQQIEQAAALPIRICCSVRTSSFPLSAILIACTSVVIKNKEIFRKDQKGIDGFEERQF